MAKFLFKEIHCSSSVKNTFLKSFTSNFSINMQYQGEEDQSGGKKSFSFFEDSPLQSVGNGTSNALSDTLLEHKKAIIASKLEALRKATAKIHLNKNFPQKDQADESAEESFPTQDGRQKRGGNKLRKRSVADCLKAYCEPVGKSTSYTKGNSQVKTSANGFSHQFTESKVNSDLMDSIKSDLNKSKKFFVSRSEDNDNQVYSKYFSQAKINKTTLPTSCDQSNNMCLMKQPETSEAKTVEKETEESYDSYFDESSKDGKELEDSIKSETKL
ncbi:hypothetical protein ACFFRR_002421 [Megaselia abdita]